MQYWWCEELANSFNATQNHESIDELSSKQKQKTNKKSNKIVFKPMIIEKADEILDKLQDLSDKDSVMFK